MRTKHWRFVASRPTLLQTSRPRSAYSCTWWRRTWSVSKPKTCIACTPLLCLCPIGCFCTKHTHVRNVCMSTDTHHAALAHLKMFCLASPTDSLVGTYSQTTLRAAIQRGGDGSSPASGTVLKMSYEVAEALCMMSVRSFTAHTRVRWLCLIHWSVSKASN